MNDFLVLSRNDLRQIMRFGDYVEAVAEAFQLLADGRCQAPVPSEITAQHGTFHIKAGSLPLGTGYVAVKINANFPSNKARHGLPTIQGAVYLAAASNGRALPSNALCAREVQRNLGLGPKRVFRFEAVRIVSPAAHLGVSTPLFSVDWVAERA